MSERNGKYYTMAQWSPFAYAWGVEFGDHDYQTVKAERQDYIDHGAKAKHLVIFHTMYEDGQKAIDEQVSKIPIPE